MTDKLLFSMTCESCAHCPWMAMNALQNLETALRDGTGEVFVDEPIRQRAVSSIQRMLEFAASRK